MEVWTDYQHSATHGKTLEQHTSLISITSNSLFSNCHMATALDAITIDYHFSRRGVYLSKKSNKHLHQRPWKYPFRVMYILALLPAGIVELMTRRVWVHTAQIGDLSFVLDPLN